MTTHGEEHALGRRGHSCCKHGTHDMNNRDNGVFTVNYRNVGFMDKIKSFGVTKVRDH
jgi:hypothetical protein